MCEHPTLFFITGPIGVGKSTCAVSLFKQFLTIDFEFISSDTYYYLYFKDNNGTENDNYRKAKAFRDYKIRKAMAQRQSFVWESVFDDKKISTLETFSEQGYRLIGLFVGTDDVDILLSRARSRASEDWYDIPAEKIKNRYTSMMNALARLSSISKIFIIVNATLEGFSLAYCKNNGDVAFVDQSCSWIKRFLSRDL